MLLSPFTEGWLGQGRWEVNVPPHAKPEGPGIHIVNLCRPSVRRGSSARVPLGPVFTKSAAGLKELVLVGWREVARDQADLLVRGEDLDLALAARVYCRTNLPDDS